MKRLLLIISLSALTLGFSGCLGLDDGESVYYFTNEPAIVSYESQSPMIKTMYGMYSTPYLSDTLKAGNCLWTNFILDMNGQSDAKNPVISGLEYYKLGLDMINAISGNMEDDYNDFIFSAGVYKAGIDSVLFFEFTHPLTTDINGFPIDMNTIDINTIPFKNEYTYEIMYNTDSVIQANGQEIPKLYIKSKKLTKQIPLSRCRFAFDMAEFILKYADSDSKKVPLYFHYKTGTTPEGKDIYKSFQTYPVVWNP